MERPQGAYHIAVHHCWASQQWHPIVVLVSSATHRKHSSDPFVVPRFIGAVQRIPAKDRMNAVTTNGS